MKTSIDSLLKTTKNLAVEIIIIENKGVQDDSSFFIELLNKGDIQCYIKNAENLSFGFARNQGIAMAAGKFFVIADNDILYQEGWLEESIDFLNKYPDKKIYTSYIDYPTGILQEKYHQGKLGETQLSMRAGSNCFVIRREDFFKVGLFKYHRIAGTKWTDEAVKKGYLCAVLPGRKMKDLALRIGYSHNLKIPIKRTLRNGEEIIFNED